MTRCRQDEETCPLKIPPWCTINRTSTRTLEHAWIAELAHCTLAHHPKRAMIRMFQGDFAATAAAFHRPTPNTSPEIGLYAEKLCIISSQAALNIGYEYLTEIGCKAMMSISTKNLIRHFSAIVLGIIIPVGFSLVFLEFGILSYLSPIPSGLALGLLLVTRKSLEKEAVSAILAGILTGSICIILYVFAFQHETTFPKIELLAVAILFGIGPLIHIGIEWFRQNRRTV
jgi:hypothetical protein